MPRTIESLQQIMHGLYPTSKYPQGLTPQLLVRCVSVSFRRTSKLAFHRILGALHPCLHDRATCESLFFHSTPCEIVFIYCQCISPHVYFQECQRREPYCESIRLQAVGKNEYGFCSRYTSGSMMRTIWVLIPLNLLSGGRCFESHTSNTR
jgi:hypothetical protein